MKRIFAIISLAALMMPVSCMKDEMVGADMKEPASKGMVFTAVMEGSDTKTTLNETTGVVAWAVGDAIKFDYEIQKVDSAPVVSSSLKADDINNGTATFKVEIPDVFSMTGAEYNATLEEGTTPSRHLYVVYPASVETEYVNSGYTVTIPAVQDGKFESASISLAKWDINEPTAPLDFRNLCGLLQVKVADENVRQIKVSSSDYIAGRANVGFASKVPFDPYVKNMYEEGSSKTITVNVDGAGTYYIAVAPGTLLDFCVALYDVDGELLGDRAAKTQGAVAVERNHILPLGLLSVDSFETGPEGSFFVTPEGRGTKDGSSWGNAADYNTFVAHGNKTTTIKNAYLSEGIYEITAQKALANGVGFNIFGGYPSDAICCDLSRRDVEKYPSVFNSDGVLKTDNSGHRLWNIRNGGTWVVDGFIFQNFAHSEGGVINVSDASILVCRHCTFKNCTGTKLAGAVCFAGLTSTESLFENCKFLNNTCDATYGTGGGFGGAIGAFGSPASESAGLVTFKKCVFKDNTTKYAGGAVASRVTSMHFVDCNFIDNLGGPLKGYIERSSTLFTDATIDLSLYCDRCYFANSNAIDNVNTSIISNHSERENVTVCLNNSVVSGYWGYGNAYSVANTGLGKIVVSNSTLLGQSGATI